MKTILLTGGTGFLGSHLLEELENKGFNIIVLKRSHSKISHISEVLTRVKFYNLDEMDGVESIFKNEKINIIIHTATDYGRRDSDFNQIIETNLLFPLRLMELGIMYGVSVFMNSDTFWDENIELPIGLSYYAYSKKDFIRYAKKLIETSNTKLVNIKIEHLYGPRDNNKKFIPSIIERLLNNVESIDLTSGEQKKDFIYIKDAVSAYMFILDNLHAINNSFEEFDLGTGKTSSIKDLVFKISVILKSNTYLDFGKIPYRNGEPMESKADTSKLNQLGWTPMYDIDKGIKETINYFKLQS